MLTGDMLPDTWSSPVRETSPSRRRRVPRLARKAIRWGLLGGACCFLSWCGLAAVSTGTAHAATDDGAGLIAVQQPTRGPVEGIVDAVTTDLAQLAHHSTSTEATPGSHESGAEPAKPDQAAAGAKEALDHGIDRLTTLATSLDGVGVPVRATAGAGGASEAETTSVDIDAPTDVPAPATSVDELSADAAGTAAASHGTSTTDGPREAVQEHGRSSHVPATADAGAPEVVAGGLGGDGDTPVHPFYPRALTSSTTSSSSAGGSTVDGGSGARVIAFHLPYVARSVTAPARSDVEVPWNPAGKPRVSPD